VSNSFATTNVVAREALAIIKNTCAFGRMVNRDYQDEFSSNMSRGYAPGQTINIKRPPRFTYRAGPIAVPQAITETTLPLTLSQGGADIQVSDLERTLSLTQFEDKMMALMAPVVNEIDRQGLALAHFATFNTLNPTGALPTSAALAIQAMTDMGRRLDEEAAPRDLRRGLALNPALNGALVQGFGGYFNNQGKISDQNRTGLMTNQNFGFADVQMDQNVDAHTNGAATATNINGAGQTGSAITVVAIAGGTLTRGSTITLPGVFAVNPQSRTTTGVLKNFVVTADALVGATTINISPAIVTSGAFQNVTASPTTGAPYVIFGAASTTYGTSVGFHKDAFTLAMVPLYTPEAGMGVKCTQMSEDGYTVRVKAGSDIVNDTSIFRIDVLYGWAATYPELSVKYLSV
jgi:P22 coat protein - gene protein 5